MTNDPDYVDYGDFEESGTGPLHEVSPRKSKEPVANKDEDAVASN